RTHEERAVPVAHDHRPARAADARVDDGKMNALRHVGKRVPQDQRSLEDGLRRDAVRDVDDLDLRRDPLDHAVARAHQAVRATEVAEEREEAVIHRPDATASTAATSPSRSCVGASATTVSPALVATIVVWGPIDTAEAVPPIAA